MQLIKLVENEVGRLSGTQHEIYTYFHNKSQQKWLSNTIKLTTGLHPCYFYEEKIMNIAKSMLEKNEEPISAIASLLTYDPSNFTKFFKRFEKKTPKQYREDYLMSKMIKKT